MERSISRRAFFRWAPYVLATALCVGILFVFTLTSWNRATERQERRLEALAVLGSQAVNAYLTTLQKSLADLAVQLLKADCDECVGARLKDYKAHYPEFEVVVARDLAGSTFASSSATLPDLRGQATLSESLERLKKGEAMVVNRAFPSKVSGVWVTPLSYGVRDAAGQLKFTLGAALSQERTHDFWKNAPLPPGAAMGMIRDDFYIVARYPPLAGDARSYFAKPVNGLLGLFLKENGYPKAGTVRGTTQLSGKGVVVFRRLADHPLTFYVYDPFDNVRRDWWNSTWPTYALIILLYFGGLGIGLWSRTRQLAWTREREARVEELEETTLMLKASIAELENTNSELESFTHAISHDMRAPIRAIQGFSQMAQADLETSSDGRAYVLLGRIQDRAKRMATLMVDLLELSRLSKQALNKETVGMRALAESVVEELGQEYPNSKVELGDLPECKGDPVLLRQVLGNLVSNALKYSAKVENPVVRIGFADGAYFVSDNGAGFDMAESGKLFQLFSRLHTESEFSGTGVGLTIVKRIVGRHGGRIWADSRPGVETRFSWTIPG